MTIHLYNVYLVLDSALWRLNHKKMDFLLLPIVYAFQVTQYPLMTSSLRPKRNSPLKLLFNLIVLYITFYHPVCLLRIRPMSILNHLSPASAIPISQSEFSFPPFFPICIKIQSELNCSPFIIVYGFLKDRLCRTWAKDTYSNR